MKLKAINKNIEKYGYPQTMEYNNRNFNGHQVGVAICLQNNITNKIEENYLSESLGDEETRNFLLSELLREEKALFITEVITQLDENSNQLVPKTLFYMPYFVEEHSRFKPTIMNRNISDNCDTTYTIEVELGFTTEGYSRYLTVLFNTCNVPVFELVSNLFDDEKALSDLGIKWNEETEEGIPGYVLDFYSSAGNKYNFVFENTNELKNILVSMRMIDIVCNIDKEENNEV